MRLAGQTRMGYYPTPPRITEMIRERVQFPPGTYAALDPCCGEGFALHDFTDDTNVQTYGIEPDDVRSDDAATNLDNVLHCAIEDTRVAHKSFSVLWLNPPYDYEAAEDAESKCERKEITFLRRSSAWLAPGGVLIYIIPESVWSERLRTMLSYRFDNLDVWRFPEPECWNFHQLVVMGIRKERDQQAALPDIRPDGERILETFKIPVGNPNVPLFQSTRITEAEAEKLVANSSVWRSFLERSRGATIRSVQGKRPPLPFHRGHMLLMLASGMIDGVVGQGSESHVVKGKVTKDQQETKSCTTNPENGTTTQTTKLLDEYTVSIKLLTRDGEIRELQSTEKAEVAA